MNESSMKGRTAIVTGSGRNIGRAIALSFARLGANVVVNGHRDRDAVDAVVEEVRATGAQALAHMADHSRAPWGPGFLQASAPAQAGLMRYHMNDNVTSVHVMGAFGRVNAALFVFTLFIALAVVSASAGRSIR